MITNRIEGTENETWETHMNGEVLEKRKRNGITFVAQKDFYFKNVYPSKLLGCEDDFETF